MSARLVRAVLAAALLAAATGAAADVKLANPWMRPAAPGDDADVYVDIRSDASLTLVAVVTPVAKAVEIRVAEAVDGPTKAVPSLAVAAGRETRFAYRGSVLRLVGVRQQLANGTPVPLTLEFRDAAGKAVTATTNVEVRGLVVRRSPAAADAKAGAAPATAPAPATKPMAPPEPAPAAMTPASAPEPAPKM
jgi:copper(I)-binding protein